MKLTAVVWLCLLLGGIALQLTAALTAPEAIAEHELIDNNINEEEDLEEWRLIEVGEGERIWMQRKDVLQNMAGIPGARSHFFDVTDLPTLGPESAPTAPPIPDHPSQQVLIYLITFNYSMDEKLTSYNFSKDYSGW